MATQEILAPFNSKIAFMASLNNSTIGFLLSFMFLLVLVKLKFASDKDVCIVLLLNYLYLSEPLVCESFF